MSGDVSNRKRLVSITAGNIRHNHIYLSGQHDFFPKKCYGRSNSKNGLGQSVRLLVDGLPEPVETDIAIDETNGNPRNFFRKRSWVRKFFVRHSIREGDVIAIERLGQFSYRIYPFESKATETGLRYRSTGPQSTRPVALVLSVTTGDESSMLRNSR